MKSSTKCFSLQRGCLLRSCLNFDILKWSRVLRIDTSGWLTLLSALLSWIFFFFFSVVLAVQILSQGKGYDKQ